MDNIRETIKICIGMFLCLICCGCPLSLLIIKLRVNGSLLFLLKIAGSILGALFAGVVLDRFGRRKMMIFSGLWILFTIDCQPWLPSDIFFYLHGVSGFGYGMIFVIYIVYISETICAKYRGLAVSLNCAARTISGSITVLLYNSKYFDYYWSKPVAFVFLVVLALTGLVCIYKYDQETPFFIIQKNRANNHELQSNINPIIDQVEPVVQQIESNSNNTEILENDLCDKNNILKKHPFKVYFKSILLILIFRLPLLMVLSVAFMNEVYGSVLYADFINYYPLLLLALVPILVTVGFKTRPTCRRKSILLVYIFIVTLLLFVISGSEYLLHQEKIEMSVYLYFIFPLYLSTQIVNLAGLFHCYDLLLVDVLPLKFRSLNVALIFCIEHLIDLLIVLSPLLIHVHTHTRVLMLACICAISGIVMYFKFDSLYTIYQ